ncbi:hypothetical protein CW706_04345 [Candidatus Bathyarchaeota archaeon]|nr:MAG: hypothetical protein CW706_04345 [Candidatus Bathyarchaeota archaeon]
MRGEMKVGFSTVDITPPLGSEVPGYFTKRFFYDIHDPLHVKAAVFESEETRVALVSVDALSIKASIVKFGRELAEEMTGIPADHIMVAATHTHSGGPTVEWASNQKEIIRYSSNPELIRKILKNAPEADPEYLRFLSYKIASAVMLADKHKTNAKCAVGIGKEFTVSFNRRFRMKNGRQMTHPGKGNPNIVEPAGPIDPDVGVLSVWDSYGSFLGCIVNFTCHGTTMNGVEYSADWPYYLDKTIRSIMGWNSTVIFLNGACGDVTQVDNQSMREMEFGEKWSMRVGQKVGAEALKVIADAEPADLKPIKATRRFIRIEKRKVPPERLRQAYEIVSSEMLHNDPRWLFARDIILLNEWIKIEPAVRCEIQAVQIGPAVFISNPAELFCQLGLEIKSASKFPFTFIVELANGCIGYVPTEESMGPSGGGYEVRMGMHSFLIPSAGRIIVEESIKLINSLVPGEVPEAPKVSEVGKPWSYGSVGPEEV